MEIRFPLFKGGRILRKESLWDIRDYAYGGWQLHYADYTDGIISGCGVRLEDSCIVIGKGMMKYRDFIYLVQKEVRVPYEPTDKWAVLKAEFAASEELPDYHLYRVKCFLDDELERKENQIELCRFCLRRGSELRAEYRDLEDMSTEYDTIHLLHATVADKEMETLHPKILLQFAGELALEQNREREDFAFLYEIQNHAGQISRKLIAQYLLDKNRGMELSEICSWNNEKLYAELKSILTDGRRHLRQAKGKRVIYVE